MAGYFLVDVLEVTDPARMEAYRKRVSAVVEKFGGKYLIAGGQAEVAEGNWHLTFPVLIQFPTLEDAHRWYDSEDYRELKAMRLAATRSNAVFLPGR